MWRNCWQVVVISFIQKQKVSELFCIQRSFECKGIITPQKMGDFTIVNTSAVANEVMKCRFFN